MVANPLDRPVTMLDEMNERAYMDVLDRKEPTLEHNDVYMKHYRFWREIANWPEDQIEE